MAGLTRYNPPFGKGFHPTAKCSSAGAGGGPKLDLRMYYPLDGVDDGVVLGENHIIDGTPIEVDFLGFVIPTNSYGRMFKNEESYELSVDTDVMGDKFRLTGCTATINGVPIVTAVTPLPTSGNNKMVITPLPSMYGKTIRRFGYAAVGGAGQRYLQITFTRIKIGSAVMLAMDDGTKAGNVLINTGTGGNAAGNNFNSNRWYESEVI